jgi:hypothetical protein
MSTAKEQLLEGFRWLLNRPIGFYVSPTGEFLITYERAYKILGGTFESYCDFEHLVKSLQSRLFLHSCRTESKVETLISEVLFTVLAKVLDVEIYNKISHLGIKKFYGDYIKEENLKKVILGKTTFNSSVEVEMKNNTIVLKKVLTRDRLSNYLNLD